ncbi:SagB-type dehydrogenase domain-containing protein [Sphaerisporangium melleum]|uniref:SagB-type dehydrogenase domain-containing protein n=1 Tax=Sphaerisporangium melleum TaxID=321316 RepID=A0A917VM34_9ACTN|nr:SagB family peptide dehydrogenase [Sphaerisporangium melleum]GGK97842.1 SagB-type dehydrogenase domain-containing protein [Sphaerisporangium melleum]GII73666.1 SagB-type dehydrogenase domain-containing protein [Sphaerisporangium melleum]
MNGPDAPRPLTMVGLREDAVVTVADGVLTITHPFGRTAVRGLPPGVQTVLGELPGTLAGEDELAGRVLAAGGTSRDVAVLYLALAKLAPVLVHAVEPLLRVVPIARDAVFHQPALAPDDTVRLSRFALLRRSDDGLILESPLSRHVVTLTEEAVPLIAALGRPVMVKQAPEVLGHLVAAGLARTDDTEERDPALRAWDFHDLLFHARSRAGRHDRPFGATFRFLSELPPEPVVKRPPDGPAVELYRPSLEEAAAADPPFTTVLETRRSVREYAGPPTLRQLGELLYRAARVRKVVPPAPGMPYEASSRPYPGGGAVYELELYLTVARCEGLAAGVYHYDPLGHRLHALPARPEDAQGMLSVARLATGGLAEPDVLITMTSRFQRMSWKYSGLAYGATLKNVGALYQTLYLVATAMGLSPCGLGSGDADLAARTFGLDWERESSVGDFLIGGPPRAAASGS